MLGRARDDIGPRDAAPRLARGVVMALTAAFAIGFVPVSPIAQTTGSNVVIAPYRIAVAESIEVAPGGAPTSVTIEVAPRDNLPPNAFVRLKGLPEGAALTDGYAVGPGTWAVALNGLSGLKAFFPQMPPGRRDLGLQLLSVDGAVLAETRAVLVFAKPAETAAVSPPPPPSPPPVARAPESEPKPPALSADERQKAERLVAQGDRFLDSGNVAVARQYFQRAADAGLAAGALKLGATFDPAELDRLAVQGVVAQPAEAKRWYERALQLGAREAKERLARLAGTN